MPVTPHHLRAPAPQPPAAQRAFARAMQEGRPLTVAYSTAVRPALPLPASDGCDQLDPQAIGALLIRSWPEAATFLKGDPQSVWRAEGQWIDKPYAHDLMRVLLLRQPELVFANLALVERLPDTGNWLLHAAWKDPHAAFEEFYTYDQRAEAPAIIAVIAAALPVVAPALALGDLAQLDMLHNFGHAADFKASLWYWRDAMLEKALTADLVAAATDYPIELYASASLWRDRADAPAIRAAATDPANLAREAAAAPITFVDFHSFLRDLPDVKNLIEIAMAAAEAKDRQDTFYNKAIREMNRLHESPDHMRFALIENETFDARRLYDLLTASAADEFYTSSFNGAMSRFLKRADAEHIDLHDIAADPVRRARQFGLLEMSGTYGRADDLLQRLSPAVRADLLVGTLRAAEGAGEASDLAGVADLIRGVHNPALLADFEVALIRDYENARTKRSREKLGLLVSSYAEGRGGRLNFPDAIRALIADPYYALPDDTVLPSSRLYDDAGRSIQVVTFNKYYEGQAEPDGDASFQNMLATFRKAPRRWHIDAYDSYVHISSRGTANTVHIFANRPEYDGTQPGKDGIADIDQVLTDMQADRRKLIVVQRGHSYHLGRITQDGDDKPEGGVSRFLNDRTPIVYVGSCGSGGRMVDIVRAAPNVAYVGTKGIGEKYINDNIIFYLSDHYLREGRPVDWDEVWQFVDKLHSSAKGDYLNPAHNTAFRFLQAEFRLTQRDPVNWTVPALPAAKLNQHDEAGPLAPTTPPSP